MEFCRMFTYRSGKRTGPEIERHEREGEVLTVERICESPSTAASPKSSVPDTSAASDASDLLKPSFGSSLVQFPWHSVLFYLL